MLFVVNCTKMTLMKKVLPAILIIISLFSCKSHDSILRNPNLQNVSFRYDINLALNTDLMFSGGSLYFPNAGIRGIFVHNTGATFMAWEASDPNHPPNDCSTMIIEGAKAICSCEGYEYSLSVGLLFNPPDTETQVYPMLNYRAIESGGVITVSN